jgi:hypothetical protein
MKALIPLALALALLFSGCASNNDSSSSAPNENRPSTSGNSHPTTGGTTSHPSSSGSSSGSTSQPSSSGSSSGSSSSSSSDNGNGDNGNPSVYGVIVHQSFTGALPDATGGQADPPFGAVIVPHVFNVSKPGNHLVLYYNTTYTGLFPANIRILDNSGAVAAQSSGAGDPCAPAVPPTPGAQQATTCVVDLPDQNIAAGNWNAEIDWQVGETVEDYSIEVTVWGMT